MAKIVLDFPDELTPISELEIIRSLIDSSDFEDCVILPHDLVTHCLVRESFGNSRSDS